MKKTFLKKIILVLSFLIAFQVFAEIPSVKTLDAVAITEQSAFLRTEFNSNGNNYHPNKMPLVWFIYGSQEDILNRETPKETKTKGWYIFSQKISGLEEDTEYWFRSAISFEGETYYGEILSFHTKQKETLPPSQEENQISQNSFLTSEELLQQYEEATRGGVFSDEEEKVTIFKNNEPLEGKKEENHNFFSFWSWIFGGKDRNQDNEKEEENINQPTNQQEENIRESSSQKENLPEKHFNNSASEDDELGEVLEYNTHYKNTYKKNRGNTNNRVYYSHSTNYTSLFIIIFLLIVFVVLIRFVYLSYRKRQLASRIHHRYHQANQYQPRKKDEYYIPIRKDLINTQRQNPDDFLNKK